MASILVAGDSGSILRVTVRDRETKALLDLTGKTVQLRYAMNGGATVEKSMTLLNQTTSTGQAQYQFLSTDLTAGGELKGEVRVQDGLPDQLTSVDFFHILVKAPLP